MAYQHLLSLQRAMCIPSIFLLGLLWVDSASGHDQEDVTVLEEVQVVGERPIAASSNRIILNEDILLQPQGRPADLLRLAPGLITLEHSGGAGKSDQYLLRGFDADHGTDLALHVDGMPINMRSHAHGQGYGDLNFIIPE
ncbi:MAG: Plug domain-containing protein, partial [Nitrospirota bacterium]|nr:Plug domain-containing protein [Nitrospirota bacterium]